MDSEFDILVQNCEPSTCSPKLLASSGFICPPTFHVTFSDNSNMTFYCFWASFTIMVILTVIAYGTDGVRIISSTLKMKILRLRKVNSLLKVTQLGKIGLSCQTGLLALNPMFFPLACGASYVSYIFSPKEILFWTSFQSSFDGLCSNAVYMELTAWKCAISQSGWCLLSWNPGTIQDQCEMVSSFSLCLSTLICLFFCSCTSFYFII